MLYLNKLSVFFPLFLIVGFLFLALPEKGHAGFFVPGGPPCCQIIGQDGPGCVGGETALSFCEEDDVCLFEDCEFFEQSTCVVEGEGQFFTGVCVGSDVTRNIPTLSEWGLLVMAGAFAIIGLLILRRRKAQA